jgi:hypothetical protein
MLKRALLPLALLVASLAVVPAASAVPTPANNVPNGTYYGYSWAFNSVFAATVKNGFIFGGQFFTQNFSGSNLVPGTTTDIFGNFGGDSGNSPGYPMSGNGSWAVESDLPPEAPSVPTVCGDTKFQAKLVVSWNCTGPNGAMVGNPMFSAQTTKTPGIAPGTYSGAVQTSPVPGNPNAPWTGTEGTLNITVQNGVVSGTGLLAPVDQQTGLITGPPSVNVTYGPITIGANSTATSGSVGTAGLFEMPSTPSGYNLTGGFVPAGIAGLPPNGMFAGTVNTFTPTFNNNTGQENFGPGIAGSFQIFGSG